MVERVSENKQLSKAAALINFLQVRNRQQQLVCYMMLRSSNIRYITYVDHKARIMHRVSVGSAESLHNF